MAIDLEEMAAAPCICYGGTACQPCLARALLPRVRVLNDLTDYAQHDAGCPATWDLKPGKPCDCGLDALRAALRSLEGL